MTVSTQTWPLGGGLDLVSPALSIPPGAAILAQNFEPELSGGYRRMEGYTAYDGSSAVAAGSFSAGTLYRIVSVGTTDFTAIGASSNASDIHFTATGAGSGTGTAETAAAVPGSGNIRGIWVYDGTVYAFRDNSGGTACVMYKSTTSGWTAVSGVPTLVAGGKYEFVNANFTGSSSTMKMYGCDGKNKAFQFDGTTFTQLTTGMTTDTPSHIAEHESHLFLSFSGSIQHSAAGDPTDWTVASGAGEIGVGADITAMRGMQGGVLAIITEREVHALHGTSSADWNLKLVTAESGGSAYTAAYLENDLYFLNDAGISTLQAVQAFGDFATSNLSQKVKPFLDARKDNIVAAIASQDKNQYRIFFDDKSVLVGSFLNREILGFTTFVLDDIPSAAVNGSGNFGSVTGDVLFFGTTTGFVMRMDQGPSFNGEDIQSFLRLPFNQLKSPQRKKRFRKMVIDVDAGSQATINYSVDFDYGEKGSAEQSELIYGSGGYWGVAEWGGFTWTSPTVSRIEGYIDGSGRNLSILVRHNSSADPSFTLQGIQLNYSLRGLQR